MKLRVCPACSAKLHHKQLRRLEKRQRKEEEEERKREKDIARKRARGESEAANERDYSGDDHDAGGDGGGGCSHDAAAAQKRQDRDAAEVGAEDIEDGLDRAGAVPSSTSATSAAAGGANIWKKQLELQQNVEEDYDDYLAGMFP